MTEPQFDVIVVGAGLMGAAAAWALTHRERSVLLIDQFEAAHRNGSSHGSSRIVRRAYNDELYTRLTGQALELWRELEHETGADVLRMLGGIDFGAARDVRRLGEHLAAQSVPHELLSRPEAEARWPGMRFEGDVMFHAQAGTVDAGLALGAFVAAATRRGAEVRYGTQVVGLTRGGDRVGIELATGERVQASTVVVAAGSWIAPLLQGFVKLPPLRVTQQQFFHFPRLDPDGEPWPSVIHDAAEPIYHLAGGRDGGPHDDRKIAEHRHGTPTTAATRSGRVDAASRTRIVEYVKRWLPGLDPSPRGEGTCLYTTTPTEDFVLDRAGRLIICSACSGHGAKFAPLIGSLAADLVVSPDAAEVPARFRLASHAR